MAADSITFKNLDDGHLKVNIEDNKRKISEVFGEKKGPFKIGLAQNEEVEERGTHLGTRQPSIWGEDRSEKLLGTASEKGKKPQQNLRVLVSRKVVKKKG